MLNKFQILLRNLEDIDISPEKTVIYIRVKNGVNNIFDNPV
jgi:hypothetical protein